jgi:hypothetical protein
MFTLAVGYFLALLLAGFFLSWTDPWVRHWTGHHYHYHDRRHNGSSA